MAIEYIQLEKIVTTLEDISIKKASEEKKQDDHNAKISSVLEVIIPPSSSNPNLSELDQKTIQLLELIRQYERVINDDYRLNFVNGYLNLSRANYNHHSRRFSSNSFDYRPYNACKEISFNDESQEFSIVDKLGVDRSKVEKRKSNHTQDGDISIYDRSEKPSSSSSSASSSSTKKRPISNTTSLKNRKETSSTTKPSIITEDPEGDASSSPFLRDPINQFGALVPYQLRQSQDYFNKALKDSIDVINLQIKIKQLITEIEKLNEAI